MHIPLVKIMPIGGEVEFDERLSHCSDLPSVVLQNLKKFGNQTFLIDGLQDTSRTFKQVHDNAVRYALALRKLKIGEGTYIAFLTDTTIDAYEFTIGVWLAGGCVCPMNPSLNTGAEIAQLLETSTACFVYCDHSKIDALEAAKESLGKSFTTFTNDERENCICLSSLLTDDPADNENISLFSTTPYDPHNHITYVLFTSGTTGVSKGVMLSGYATLLAGCRIYESKGPTLVTSAFFWVSNPAAFVHSILSGSELIFPRVKHQPGTNAVDHHHIPKCIEKYKPKKWMTAPSILDLCYIPDVGDYDLSSLTHLSVGGSAILPMQKKFICETLFQANIVQERYGATEAGFLTREWSFPAPDFDDPKAASFGPPCPGVELKIVDMETGKELGPNQVGEMFVRSDAMMNGYINKDMPRRYTKEDWYDMGDIGCYDEDGWIYFKARTKEILKYRGYQIAPADLEKVILKHPDVLDACVVGAPHPIDGERPIAFVVKRGNSSLSESELQLFFDGQVSDEKKLRGGVIFKDSLPQSTVGKLLRRKLVEEAKLIMNK